MKLEIIRGDTQIYSFYRKDNEGNIIKTKANKLYFTIKENYNTKKIIIQKNINDMTFDTETGKYTFQINSIDTTNLAYGEYVYDLEVKEELYTQTISIGKFIINKEVTFLEDEV